MNEFQGNCFENINDLFIVNLCHGYYSLNALVSILWGIMVKVFPNGLEDRGSIVLDTSLLKTL